MIRNTYHLKLASPAFLGDAEQKGVWRTPPLKALIREWWRVAVAPDVGYDAGGLKRREIALFGTAADDGAGKNEKSKIRLALKHWTEGKMREHEPLPTIRHPEAERARYQVEPLNYLGYGPIDRGRLKSGAALQAKDNNTLKLAYPEGHAEEMIRTLTLVHWFGTVGGRSRNGWGSLAWLAQDSTPALVALSKSALEQTGCVRPLRDCLKDDDWPHAIGSDRKGVLVWSSNDSFENWREAMKFLAETKIGFRTQPSLRLNGGQPHHAPQDRHILAYPVTNHKVSPWEGKDKGRLANTLRFKLHAEPDGKLRALIYHTPCKPTLPHPGIDLLGTWQRVHGFLDANAQFTRLA